MPTFLSTDNWLTRRAAYALFGWGTSISGPKVTATNENVTHSKHYFVGFPQNWVIKRALGCGGDYGTLFLECTRTERTVEYHSPYNSTAAVGFYYRGAGGVGYTPANLCNDPSGYTSGDGHVYRSMTLVWNDIPTAGTYVAYDYYYDFDGSGNTQTYIGVFGSPQGTSGQAVAGNDYTNEGYAQSWNDKMTPDDVMDAVGYTPSVTTSSVYFHKPGDADWGNGSTLIMSSATWDATYGLADSSIGSVPYSTIRWDQDWTATGKIEHHSCSLRWRYNPNSSFGCKHWEGVQASVKVFYKKRPITKTDSSGVTLTFGSAVDGGSDTRTITLQNLYTEHYVSDAFAMPEEEGYAYVIDDVEVLSVTLP